MHGKVREMAMILVCALFVSCSAHRSVEGNDRERLLALHADGMEAHWRGSVEMLLRAASQDFLLVNRGEISHPTLEERRARFAAYLGSTRFEEYRDVVAPVVTVSRDGTLGWVAVQVRARGEQTAADGTKHRIAFESAWIELYEKRGHEWVSVGNVSNFKP